MQRFAGMLIYFFVAATVASACKNAQKSSLKDSSVQDADSREATRNTRFFFSPEVEFKSGKVNIYKHRYEFSRSASNIYTATNEETRLDVTKIFEILQPGLPCFARLSSPTPCTEEESKNEPEYYRNPDMDSDRPSVAAKAKLAIENNVSPAEFSAILDYSASGSPMRYLAPLFDRTEKQLSEYELHIKMLSSALKKLDTNQLYIGRTAGGASIGYHADGNLYHGGFLCTDQLEFFKKNVGKSFYYPAFMSASYIEVDGYHWASRGKSAGQKVCNELDVPIAVFAIQPAEKTRTSSVFAHARDITDYALAGPNENEYLFIAGSHFKIDGVKEVQRNDKKYEWITLTELP